MFISIYSSSSRGVPICYINEDGADISSSIIFIDSGLSSLVLQSTV